MNPPAVEGPIWLVGCGNMAGAMLRRWLATGLDPARVTVVRKSGAAVADRVTALSGAPVDTPPPALVLLGVKPQMVDLVAPWLAPLLTRETLLVSILAGVEIAALRRRFATPHAIVRAMPNTPVAIGRGVVALAGEAVAGDVRARVDALMAPLGLVEWLDEALLDVVSAVSGSGPAYLFRFVDTLAAAGADAGLDPAQAERLALATAAGAGLLAAESGESPAVLADRVTSPGGSTRRALDVLDAPDALRALMRDAVAAAVLRNREMGEAAR